MMNWPEELEDITVVGFSDSLLPILMEAIDNDHVEWVKRLTSVKAADGRYSEFDYLGFRYGLDELFEVTGIEPGADGQPRETHGYVPVRIEKIAKVDVDDDGNVLILERCPLSMASVERPPKYQGAWASF
jgi:hypothetical protein